VIWAKRFLKFNIAIFCKTNAFICFVELDRDQESFSNKTADHDQNFFLKTKGKFFSSRRLGLEEYLHYRSIRR